MSKISKEFPALWENNNKYIYIYYYILYLRFATMRWTKSWHNDSLPVAQPLQVPVFNKGWPYLATDQPALGSFFRVAF